LADAAAKLWPRDPDQERLIVCTGGEPLLQLDEALIQAFKAKQFKVAVETNGTVTAPGGIDWICVSPKGRSPLAISKGNELKLVFPQDGVNPSSFESLDFNHFLLQPMDGANRQANTELAVRYCLSNPKWRVSLQLHKIVGVP
jgi:7-carboxy-7-deazaguanine synthase (Cx14CxxC type)